MSTLRDLFNIKIGLTKKAVFVEKLNNSFLVFKTEERTPVREKVHINRYYTDSFEEIFNEEGITRENIYYIISPHHYYRNTLRFPFSEQHNILHTSLIITRKRGFVQLKVEQGMEILMTGRDVIVETAQISLFCP